jgi:hypothetical protein
MVLYSRIETLSTARPGVTMRDEPECWPLRRGFGNDAHPYWIRDHNINGSHCALFPGSFAHFGRELDQVSESGEERRKWR